MKKIILAALAAGTALTALAPVANAADGCAPGWYRGGPTGGCHRAYGRPYGPAYIAPGLAIGVFYPGRGYWDGHRYWWHRRGWGGGWRYY